MNAYVKGGIVVVLLLAGIFFWYQHNLESFDVNRPPDKFQMLDQMEKDGVPDFTVSRMDGSSVKLSEYRGKIVVVNFWASWCNPCVEEFPSMVKLVETFKGEVVVLAISTDDHKEDIDSFIRVFGLPKKGFEVLWDKDKTVMNQFGVDKIPESFIVGKDMKLLRKVLGIEDWSSTGAIAYFASLLGVGNSKQPQEK